MEIGIIAKLFGRWRGGGRIRGINLVETNCPKWHSHSEKQKAFLPSTEVAK